MPFFAKQISRLLVIALLATVLTACGQAPQGYGFVIENVSVIRGYQSLNVRLKPEMHLSEDALTALRHGVTLIIQLDMELRNDNNMIVVRRDTRRFQLGYLPLSERYQLKEYDRVKEVDRDKILTFSRLRHVFAAIGDMSIKLETGPLPPGNYELRTRIHLDESLLPAPMQLPAMFSSQWRHDSEWSVWPFKVSV